jgi:predicted component of type VI protein secretion system
MIQSGFMEVRHGTELRQVPVLPSVMGIGRSQDNQIVLDDPVISRHHARLQWAGSSLQIVDLGSNNGTMVNGLRVQPNYPTTLKDGDTVSVGGFSMMVRLPMTAGAGETIVSGPAAYPNAPAYTPMPYPTQPPPQVMPPLQPQMPQVIRVEVPREAPPPLPAVPVAPAAAPQHKTSWAPWVFGAVAVVVGIVLLNMPMCTATKTVSVDVPTTQTVMKSVTEQVPEQVPDTQTSNVNKPVYVGWLRDVNSQYSITAMNDKIADFQYNKNFNGLFDVTLTDVDGRQRVYRNVVNWSLDKTGQVVVPVTTTTTKTVMRDVTKQVPDQVTTMVKQDKETKVKVTPWQLMTGDY